MNLDISREPMRDAASFETRASSSAYEGLIYNLFRSPRSAQDGSAVIAFTSALAGEGVTHVVSSIFDLVERGSSSRSTSVDMRWLKEQRPDTASDAHGRSGEPHSGWASSWEYRKRLMQQLRGRFRYVGIDCPSLAASNDVLSLAPFVDGVVLVIEADRTRKSQIRNAERQIEAAGGTILGLILNKRRFPIPESIYNLL